MTGPGREPRFRLLPLAQQWGGRSLGGVVTDATWLRLAAGPHSPFRLDSRDGSLGRLTLPRGVAVDPVLRVYLLWDRRVWRLDPRATGDRPFAPLPELGGRPGRRDPRPTPRRFRAPVALAVDCGNLYVLDRSPPSVQVFDFATLHLRAIWPLPPKSKPTDVLTCRGRVFVLGRRALYRWRPGDDDFVPVEGAPGGTRLAADREGRLYVLTRQDGRLQIEQLDDEGRPIPDAATVTDAGQVRDRFDPPAVWSLPDTDPAPLRLLIPRELLRECGRERPSLPVGLLPESLFLRGPRPASGQHPGDLVVTAAGRRVALDELRQPRTAAYAREGTWVSDRFDGRVFRCRWDKLELELPPLPSGCGVEVHTTAADDDLLPGDVANLPDAAWDRAFVLHPVAQPEATPTTGGLIVSGPGRYLWVKLRLTGNGFASPALTGLRAYFPRSSYLDLLPAVFREDEESRNFLERFLAVFQAEWDTLERRADRTDKLFDPLTARPQALTALANLLGHRLSPAWSEGQQRRFLSRLPKVLFADGGGARSGTPDALRALARAYAEAALDADLPDGFGLPLVIEGFRERDYRALHDSAAAVPLTDVPETAQPVWGAEAAGRFRLDGPSLLDVDELQPDGDPALDAFATHAHRFRVVVPAAWVAGPGAAEELRDAIDAAKPAHTAFTLDLVGPGFRIGPRSTVGVDTILGDYDPTRLVGGDGQPPPGGRLGSDAVLGGGPPPRPLAIGGERRLGDTGSL